MEAPKNEFSAKKKAEIAHDFRIVLANICSLNELLLDELSSKVSPEINEYMKLIAEQCKLGFEITDDIIKERSFETILLNELLEKQIRLYKHQVIHKNINLKSKIVENLIYVKKNPVKLIRILNNLINNAIKFTPRNGEIEISLSENKIISIKDTGIGINEEYQNCIFKKSKQYLRLGTEKESSRGLGLNICKILSDELNAKIWFESEENNGTTFFLEL